MSDASPILILSASAGAGHLVAARAIEEELRRLRPDVPVEVHDLLAHTNGIFRAVYAEGYLRLVNYLPAAMGMLYEATDRPGRSTQSGLRSAVQNLCAGPARRLILNRKPRLIINTHFFSAEIVAHLRRSKRLTCPQVTATTDFDSHPIWVQPPTERYYTANEDGRAYLVRCGVDAGRVLATGIAVRRAFCEPVDRTELRTRLGLPLEKPVVLLLCGGLGVGPTEQMFAELAPLTRAAQLAVICGRNARRRQRLERVAQRTAPNARIIGHTDAMHEWMRAADLAVSKPGGLTSAEALVCGLPLVIMNPIPGQEARNSDYLLEHGAAIKVNNVAMLSHRVGELLADGKRLACLRQHAESIARPDAAECIAKDALRLIEKV